MKKIGIIDIGTNTIRGVLYDLNSLTFEKSDVVLESQILKHTIDCKLDEKGIDFLRDAINHEKAFLQQNGAEKIYSFATSAMRDVKNFDKVYESILSLCNIKIELLSEEDEAYCDFLSLKNALGNSSKGVGIDLGGGSMQSFVFDEEKLLYFSSFPIGVKRLYNKFDASHPNEEKIIKYINEFLKNLPVIKSEYLYVMGGTGKNIKKILDKTKGINKDIPTDILSLKEEPFKNEENYKQFIRLGINTIPYGILTISEVAKKIGAKNIKIMNCSSRDGFAIQKYNLLKK